MMHLQCNVMHAVIQQLLIAPYAPLIHPGLDDAADPTTKQLNGETKTAGLETFSVKSSLSSHASDKSSKRSIDPLAAYADTFGQRESSDKASIKSTTSKASRTSTLKEETFTKPLVSQSDYDWDDANKSLSRKSSVESATKMSRPELGQRPSADALVKPSLSRKSSTESAGMRSNASHHSSKASVSKLNSTANELRRPSAPSTNGQTSPLQASDDGEELESHVDFGKTTLFGKTRDLGLTYKALSQASDEDTYSDNFSDKPYDDEDGF